MERLGLGPDVCLARNPRLVYGRMTGFGQEGPLAQAAGHDINYIALAGVLAHIGRAGQPPTPPLNLVGDFGGGGLLLAFGMVCALLERERSGQGQVVDAAMVDGAAALMTRLPRRAAVGLLERRARRPTCSTAARPSTTSTRPPTGSTSRSGAIEPQFYARCSSCTGLASEELPPQHDRAQWPAPARATRAPCSRTRTRDAWCALLEGSDACFAPVLTMAEARRHPHNRARGTFVEVAGVEQPAPAPRFSRTAAAIQSPPSAPAADTDAVLADWGFSQGEIARLRDEKAVF